MKSLLLSCLCKQGPLCVQGVKVRQQILAEAILDFGGGHTGDTGSRKGRRETNYFRSSLNNNTVESKILQSVAGI